MKRILIALPLLLFSIVGHSDTLESRVENLEQRVQKLENNAAKHNKKEAYCLVTCCTNLCSFDTTRQLGKSDRCVVFSAKQGEASGTAKKQALMTAKENCKKNIETLCNREVGDIFYSVDSCI